MSIISHKHYSRIITTLGLGTLAILSASGIAAEETITVIPRPTAEDPTAPLQGIVATVSQSGTKMATPLIKTPQSISVVTRDQMDSQDAASVPQALRYTAGVFAEYRGSSNRYDEVFVRGFSYVPRFLDGLSFGEGAGSASGVIDPWLLERIEVVKGPASVLYGQANPGGLVSMTSKRPTAVPIHKIQLRGGNHHLAQGAFDFGGALNNDGTLLYRLNGLIRTQHDRVSDYKEKRYAIAPAFTWLPNSDTRFTLLTSFQKDPEAGYRNFLPAVGTVFSTERGSISRDFNVSDPSFHQSDREQYSIGYEFEHIFNDTLTFRQNARYTNIDEQYKHFTYQDSASTWLLNRRANKEDHKTTELVLDNQLKAQFFTGALDHQLLAGLDYKWSKARSKLWRHSSPDYQLDWSAPVYGLTVDKSKLALSTSELQELEQVGIYVQDQMEWNNWNLVLSGRHDWSEVRTRDYLSDTIVQQNDNKFTGRAALLYAFDNGISPYVSYSTSFQPNLQTTRAPGTAPFAPTTGKQTEVGVKYQPEGGNTLLSLSLYDLRQQNVSTYNSSLGWFEPIGEIRNRGLEVEAHSALSESINLIASYSYVDSETVQTTVVGTQGKTPARIPAHTASVWGEYKIRSGPAEGLGVGLGFRYLGTSYGNARNTYKVSAVDLYDTSLSYTLDRLSPSLKGATVQLNVNNIADTKYVASCASETACFYGVGRTITATINYEW
ncbi:TonB-dependent siderophore receptor [Intestinirhabdus alba]|jgi:iron complex outermembrane receptor protein|uniref:TonB-dependent siderophore receptor n=1 Tax=Intestinirhabdus alba TaxID=2899544 RepID=A0A6L6IU59_9ENTR|nr:TonB-dependent siderophore receptor [Intestinirhabdus alba]MTH48273.1 TonB-dependent siderophore receptor [Intestinirhabdus alba]